ncbi:VOC family protein [Fontimonas sp. SYSU GA230001]
MPKKVAKKAAAARRPAKSIKAARSARSARAARAAAKARPAKKKDGRPQGRDWPALAPYLTVRDASLSLEFYRDAFGFEVEGMVMRDADGRVTHAGMRLGDACIMFAPQGMSDQMQAPAVSGAPDSLSLYVYVPDVDAHAERAQDAGAAMLQGPADQFWGDRTAIFKDPDGYHWTFATNVGAFDASKAPD